jgi:hypothetical protein
MQASITSFSGGVTTSTTQPTLQGTANYLFSICAPYSFRASAIINNGQGGTVVSPISVNSIISPIRITSINFATYNEWNGNNSYNQPILPSYKLQIFANFIARYLIQDVEWVRTTTGVKILLDGFNATTNEYEFYIDISI